MKTAAFDRARARRDPVRGYQAALIRDALGRFGIEFTNGDAPGVKFDRDDPPLFARSRPGQSDRCLGGPGRPSLPLAVPDFERAATVRPSCPSR